MQVQDSYVYDDQDDLFTREPFVAKFTLPSRGKRKKAGPAVGQREGVAGRGTWTARLGTRSPRGGCVEKSQEWVAALCPGALQTFPAWC